MYDPAETKASLDDFLELARHLKQYHEDIVLVGGWAPFFITQGRFDHSGSRDIDLALKTEVLKQYDLIREIIESLGYQAENDARFIKDIAGSSGKVQLDLLCDKEGEDCNDGRARKVQENLAAFAFDGIGIAFDFNYEQPIALEDPFRGFKETTFKVVDLVGCFVLKGYAHYTRPLAEKRQKDAYDIFALTHFGGGPQQAAAYFNQTVFSKKISSKNKELLNGSLTYVSEIFHDEKSTGSLHVEEYSEMKYNGNVAALQMNQFLGNLNRRFR